MEPLGKCKKCGSRKVKRSIHALPYCARCDTVSKEEGEKILDLPTTEGR
jgi:ribosomal protein L37AE/L43A